jgi:hypothetical protein
MLNWLRSERLVGQQAASVDQSPRVGEVDRGLPAVRSNVRRHRVLACRQLRVSLGGPERLPTPTYTSRGGAVGSLVRPVSFRFNSRSSGVGRCASPLISRAGNIRQVAQDGPLNSAPAGSGVVMKAWRFVHLRRGRGVRSAPLTISEQIQRQPKRLQTVKLVVPWFTVVPVAFLAFRKAPWPQILPWVVRPLLAAVWKIA